MVNWSQLAKAVPNVSGGQIALVSCAAAVVGVMVVGQRSLSHNKTRVQAVVPSAGKKREDKEKAAVDGVFFRKLIRILRILVPGWFSAEAGFLGLVAAALITRTYLDVWMIKNGTAIEASIISRNLASFKTYLFQFIYAMPMIATTNAALKFGLSELKLRFRSRLTDHLYKQYLEGFTYYKMSNLDNRIANADQLLTQDAEKFCDGLADLYSNISKPILDIILYFHKLQSSIGMQGPVSMLLYLAVSGAFLTRLRRPVGRMTVTEQRLEGEFRFVNSRLITNSEEIAFYQGNRRENQTIRSTFRRLVLHLRSMIHFKFAMNFIDNIVAKYLATVVGYLVVSRPFLDLAAPRHLQSSHKEIMQDYYRSGRMLVRMAEAIGRLVLAGREMTRLAGFTARITQLMTVLSDLNRGSYQRTMVTSSNGQSADSEMALVPGSGEIVEEDHIIRFERVPLVTPNGDVLVRSLNFEVSSGMNVLVCGPNGCGKSSLFRILGELWPLFGGRLTKPHRGRLFYVPQRPYMTLGTLRDQIIYPDSKEDMERKGLSDDQLVTFLEQVKLTELLQRDGGWDAVNDWMDVLSGGEKQRVAMARLFYHRPQFAILDECTSAVSVDVEGFMYNHCRKPEVGITLFTVSHRKSLWKHHEFVLQFDGRGEYEFRRIDTSGEEFGS